MKFKFLIKKILYKYFNNLYLSIDHFLNLIKIDKLPLYNFKKGNYKFSMFTTKNFTNRNWQNKETEIILLILKNSNMFINLGANIGYYVCLASNFKLKIIAVEPDLFNLKVLFKNIKLNKISDITVLPMATYDENSLKPIYGRGVTSSLFLNWDNTTDIDNKGYVPTFKLQDLFNRNVIKENTFILADIENSELKTLIGSADILAAENKPVWIIEVHPIFYSKKKKTNEDFNKIFDIFWNNNYDSYLITDKDLKKINTNNIQNIKDYAEKYNHNYLFIDKNKVDKFQYILKHEN